MKYLITLTIVSLLFLQTSNAIEPKFWDTSFSNDGVTDGWDYQTLAGSNVLGGDILVDSQNRVLATHSLFATGPVTVLRYLPNGTLDSSFGSGGKVQLPQVSIGAGGVGLSLGKNDSFFVGYTFDFCGAVCDEDIIVYHIDSVGNIISEKNIAIDLGGTKNDYFADLEYNASIDKLVVLTTSFVAAPENFDFGIVLLNVNSTSGALTYDLNFSTDGKATCGFNHQDVNGSHDAAKSLVWGSNNQSFIVAGSAFEGNGVANTGWNLGFCEFDVQGTLLDKWSTQGTANTAYNSEQLADLKLYSFGLQQTLIVAVNRLNDDGNAKMAVVSYYWDYFQGYWVFDTNFGNSGDGWNSIDFGGFFAGNTTSDFIANMTMDKSGAVIVAGNTMESTTSTTYMALAKFNLNGTLDTNWGNVNYRGQIIYGFPNRILRDKISYIALNPRTQEVFLSGTSANSPPEGHSSFVGKLLNDLIFKQGFE